jgi:hypothetical protein
MCAVLVCRVCTSSIASARRPDLADPGFRQVTTAQRAPIADAASAVQLQPRHQGFYYPIDETRIPEAFTQWYQNRETPQGKSVPIDGGGNIRPLPKFKAGCSGLQHEFALSGYPYVMYRYDEPSLLVTPPTQAADSCSESKTGLLCCPYSRACRQVGSMAFVGQPAGQHSELPLTVAHASHQSRCITQHSPATVQGGVRAILAGTSACTGRRPPPLDRARRPRLRQVRVARGDRRVPAEARLVGRTPSCPAVDL